MQQHPSGRAHGAHKRWTGTARDMRAGGISQRSSGARYVPPKRDLRFWHDSNFLRFFCFLATDAQPTTYSPGHDEPTSETLHCRRFQHFSDSRYRATIDLAAARAVACFHIERCRLLSHIAVDAFRYSTAAYTYKHLVRKRLCSFVELAQVSMQIRCWNQRQSCIAAANGVETLPSAWMRSAGGEYLCVFCMD
jgi:hypothetical protein